MQLSVVNKFNNNGVTIAFTVLIPFYISMKSGKFSEVPNNWNEVR